MPLPNLLHRKDKLLSLLEASAVQARTSVQALLSVAKHADNPADAPDAAYCRAKDRQLTSEINQQIDASLFVSLEPEDAENLSGLLYKIPKIADKFGERLASSPEAVRRVDFSGQLKLLDGAAEVLLEMIGSLQRGPDPEQVEALNRKLHGLETEADQRLLDLYRALYSGSYDAVQVLALKDLYDMLERMIDHCRSAGNLVARIIRKNY